MHVARRARERDGRPREGAGERHGQGDDRAHDGKAEGQATDGRRGTARPLVPEEHVQAQPRQDGIEHDHHVERTSARHRGEQGHDGRVEPARLRVGDERDAPELRGQPGGDVPRRDRRSQVAPSRKPEREQVDVLIREAATEPEPAQHDGGADHDQRGAGERLCPRGGVDRRAGLGRSELDVPHGFLGARSYRGAGGSGPSVVGPITAARSGRWPW